MRPNAARRHVVAATCAYTAYQPSVSPAAGQMPQASAATPASTALRVSSQTRRASRTTFTAWVSSTVANQGRGSSPATPSSRAMSALRASSVWPPIGVTRNSKSPRSCRRKSQTKSSLQK
jgi:hypothetical protein